MAESQQEKNLKSIDDFRMFDDTFMSAVFDGKTEETQFLIRVILNRDDINGRRSTRSVRDYGE